MNRRNFVRNSSAVLAATTLGIPQWLAETQKKVGRIGIQLYTVRDDMKKDPVRALARLAEIGYQDVEIAGYSEGKFYGMTPAEFKNQLKQNGLTSISGHTQTGADNPKRRGTLINDWESAVADAAALNQKYFICAYLHEFERKTMDGYKKVAELLNKGGEVCKRYGIQMGYHNHDFEFMDLEGQIPYDLLLKETDADLVKMELDLYWVRKAKKDAIAYFKMHPGRFPLWHVKDMENTAEQFFAEVGKGVIDWKALFKERKTAGLKHFYVEQDACRNHQPLESVDISYQYLKQLRY